MVFLLFFFSLFLFLLLGKITKKLEEVNNESDTHLSS